MVDLVSKALQAADAKNSAFLPASVVRALDSEFDLGNLAIWSENEVDVDSVLQSDEGAEGDYIQTLARDNTQLLLNAIWSLPTERAEDVVVARLPPPSFLIPREKPAPKARPLTKWQQYAKEKGIEKKAKTRLVWDDVVKDWIPRFGYKKAKAEQEKNWMMEYKEGADPNVDPFEKAIEEKRERIAKNELQRLRNIARSKKVKVPGVGLTPITAKAGSATANSTVADLQKASQLAKKATASLGKFQDKLPKALESKSQPKGQKRKFDPVIQDANVEKAKNLDILNKMTAKKSHLDVNKAVGKQLQMEDRSRNLEKHQERTAKKGKSKKKGGSKTATKKSIGKRNRKADPGKMKGKRIQKGRGKKK